MKQFLKNLLKSTGHFNRVKNFRAAIKYNKYKNRKRWYLNLGDLRLQYTTEDDYSRMWFYPRYGNGKIHEPTATKIFMDYIKEDNIILDIGANLGYFTCIAGKLASKGRTYAFDVDPKCLNLIEKNLALNNINNVMVANYALSDKNETVKIKKLDSPNPGIVINSHPSNHYIEVESITVDDFLRDHGIVPDFIKIDVEGAEGKVLKGMKEVLKMEHVIILVEIHVKHLTRYFNTDYREIIDLLLKHDFNVENIDHRLNDSSFKKVGSSTILKGNTMLLCKK
jgi:FkbM family methyltransferase